MKRPQQHVTDTLGEAQMRRVFEPLGWTVNKVEHDYGIDFDIEVFRESQSTGITFTVQLKSSEVTRYSTVGFLSQRLDTANARRLCTEVRSPTILIHADIASGRTFWSAPQLDLDAIRRLAQGENTGSITVRIPTSNELPGTLERLVEAIGQVEAILASRVVITTPVLDFVESIQGRVDEEKLLAEFQKKGDALKLTQAENFIVSGSLDEARAKVDAVLKNPESSVGSKFWALLAAERVALTALKQAGGPQGDRFKIQLAITRQLQDIARHGPPHLKFFALVASKAAELDYLTHRDIGLYMNWKINEKAGDTFWKVQLIFERANVARRLAQKYNQCIRLARYAANSKYAWALPQALLRVALAVSVFIFRMRTEGLTQAADRYAQSSFELCRMAAWIAGTYEDDNSLCQAAIAACMIDPTENGQVVEWAKETVGLIKDPAIKKNAEEKVTRFVQGLQGKGAENAGQNGSPDETRQIYENMATALGVDLSDPNDSIANVVRIGIADLNPSRILKNCEHIFVTLSHRGLVADWLQLPTAGFKVIHCTLHKHAVEGLALDSSYEVFKSQYCDKCPDCSPRPPSWEYSDRWQKEENQKHAEFMREFDRRTGRQRDPD